jgi:carboxypeptidase PM20D1
MLLTLLLTAVLMLLALLAVMGWHTWRLASRQTAVPARAGVVVDAQAASLRLSQAVQLPTWWSAEDPHDQAFEALHQHLVKSFPAAHAAMQRQSVGRHALLYVWPGSDPKAQPIALLAHQDVVPIAPGTQGDWAQPPFSGAINGGFVWGRGAWDDKGSLMAIMEAVELLARSGFKPRQTIYLAFGADEELGGEDGARRISALLRQQAIRLRFALDEGLLITHGMVPGVARPVALIGLAEKGYVTLKLTAKGQPGHTSMPPRHSAIGVLSEAITRVEAQQMPAHLTGLPRDMFEAVAPEVQGVQRFILSNLWLTGPLVVSQLEKIPSANAMLRTTGVATVIQAGDRENVLPGVASASINFRLLPGDSSDAVQAHVKQLVSDLDVQISRMPQVTEASPVSRTDTGAYALVARALHELQPDVVVAPSLLVGGTDSRYYADVADAIFRFSPVHAAGPDLARFHGTNERISVANYVEMIQFYERLLRLCNEAAQAP